MKLLNAAARRVFPGVEDRIRTGLDPPELPPNLEEAWKIQLGERVIEIPAYLKSPVAAEE